MAKKKAKVKEDEPKLVEVYIRLKMPRPKTGKKIKQMHLGTVVVEAEYKKLMVDPEMLKSKQCEHWMDVSVEKPEEVEEMEILAEMRAKKAKKVAKAKAEGKLAPEGKKGK